MFEETQPAPIREPLIRDCRCCGKPLQLKWWDPRHPKITAKWQVECKNPDCILFEVTATDTSYTESTDQWLK